MIRSRKRLSPAAVLIIFCSVAYFMNYLTRYNLTASMEYMADALAPSLNGYADALAEARNRLGGALLANSVAYGIGQVVCGFLGDRIPPRYFMFFGLCGTAACNLAVFLIRDISAGVSLIVLLWCLNGIFQSCVWPAMTRIMAERLNEAEYRKGALWISYSCSLGTIAVYLLLIPGCNALFRTWRAAFIVPALLTLLTAVLMLLFVKKDVPGTENSRPEQAEQSESHREPAPGFREIWRLFLSAGIPLVMLSIVLHGFLRDGVNFWMPSMIKDTYNWGNSSSVISTAILPVFSILCVFITGKLLVMLKSEQTTSLLLWGVTLGSALLLLATYRLSPVFTVAFQAVIFGAVHGIAHLLTSRLPRRFNKYHCVSTFSGLLNASTYLGSAVSSKLSDVAEGGGWNSVILIWIAVSVLGVAATLLNLKRFHRFIRQ